MFDGKVHGVVKTYHPNGQLAILSGFREGELEGRQTFFDPEGRVDPIPLGLHRGGVEYRGTITGQDVSRKTSFFSGACASWSRVRCRASLARDSRRLHHHRNRSHRLRRSCKRGETRVRSLALCHSRLVEPSVTAVHRRHPSPERQFSVSAIAVPSRRGAPRFRGASFTWNELSLRPLEPGSLRVIA